MTWIRVTRGGKNFRGRGVNAMVGRLSLKIVTLSVVHLLRLGP